jgi:hypothetical protein
MAEKLLLVQYGTDEAASNKGEGQEGIVGQETPKGVLLEVEERESDDDERLGLDVSAGDYSVMRKNECVSGGIIAAYRCVGSTNCIQR